jgi:SAM-dependent methyltransferase
MRRGVSQPDSGTARRAGLLRRVRAGLYDAVIVPMTAGWYAAVLERLPGHCRLLDVGIGTGAALLANAALVTARDIRVTGIDIDADYVERCREAVDAGGLGDRIDVRLESVYDHAGGPYDAAYFSGSFMLLPDPVAALRHVAALLAPDARVFFTQTFEHESSPWMERVKPLLRFVTSIDFGGVTYEREFRHAVEQAGFQVEMLTPLHAGRARSSVLVVACAASAPASVTGGSPDAGSDDSNAESLNSDPGRSRVDEPDSLDGDEFDPDQPHVVPIEDALDLHNFQPRDIPIAVEGYLEAAVEKGFREVRLIHGRGTGFQRDRVRGILARHPDVESFADAPPERGGWGATVVLLKTKPT